ncbi:hypothetical protein L204_103333 [Cryptococcus depauperatus]
MEEDQARIENHGTTLFISSLPYTATSTDLLTHFSYIGPVRHGFIATEKESGKSKGVGYVTYSLKEDAERAIQKLDGKGFGDARRKIKISWANERTPLKERRVEVKLSKPIPGQNDPAKTSDPNAIRTLVISGLPPGLTKKELWKKIKKINDKAEIIFPVLVEHGEKVENEDMANVIFPSHGDALKGLPKLHSHTYKGSILSCILKKRLDKLSAKREGKVLSHAGRLIVRNLSWDTTVQDLRKAFLPYGPIHSIDLPTLPSKLPPSSDPSKPAPPPRARGFAFIWFLAKDDAEKAIEGVNGKAIKGTKDGEGRIVAVDWALSKEKWAEAKKGEDGEKQESEADGFGSDSRSDLASDLSDSEEEDQDNESNEEASDSESPEANTEDNEDGDIDMEEGQSVKPTLPTVDVGNTLFVRNLPFETTEQELNALFRTFGPLRYAKITMDRETGRSRGTGFVCFWKTEHADQAIKESERVVQETGPNAIPVGGLAAKNPFALPSLLTADPSSSLASRLVIHGRTLEVARAVTRETASLMKEDSERARNAADKRNTYLMREGVIFPNSPAAQSLPESEVEKRQASFNARKALLRGNPSLYISKTRLSIRQLPLFATDRTLKRLAIYAVKAFDAEVASGEREPLARVEEMDNTMSPSFASAKDKKKKKKERETAVIQSKIIRQTEKIDPITGQGRSKGYGFLEMRSHKEALKVLRWANNNPEVGPLMWGWWKTELVDLKDHVVKTLDAARKRGEQKEQATDNKKSESAEELEARLKKLEGRIVEGDERSGGGMRGGKTLIIEFSIENVQVVKRRAEKISSARRGSKRKADMLSAEGTDEEDSSRPANHSQKKAKRHP